jgi:glycosyltransferase involved in cell wall biosynthesis
MSADPSGTPRVSIIVPSWTGDVTRLQRSIETQTFRDFEIVVIKGVSPASRARNQGVANSRGELLVFVDDDAYLGHERVLEILVDTLESDDTIGVVGPSKLLPGDASRFQRMVAKQVPRWIYPVQNEDTESNPPLDRHGFTGITTTCCILRRRVFEQVGGFDEAFDPGEDPEFFYRIRRAGYRFIIPARCWVNHDPPGTLRGLLKKSFRYGTAHARQARGNPERQMDVIPLGRWYGKVVVAISPALFVPSMFVSYVFEPEPGWQWGFRPIKALSTMTTFYGYTYGWYSSRPKKSRAIGSSRRVVSGG